MADIPPQHIRATRQERQSARRGARPHQRLVFYTSQCSAIALGEGECVFFIGTLLVTLALDLHCLRNASRSARNTSGDMPSLTTCCRHFPRTPHTSLCLPSNKLPPEATFFEAIF